MRAAIWCNEQPSRPHSITFAQYSGLYKVGLPSFFFGFECDVTALTLCINMGITKGVVGQCDKLILSQCPDMLKIVLLSRENCVAMGHKVVYDACVTVKNDNDNNQTKGTKMKTAIRSLAKMQSDSPSATAYHPLLRQSDRRKRYCDD